MKRLRILIALKTLIKGEPLWPVLYVQTGASRTLINNKKLESIFHTFENKIKITITVYSKL